MWNWAANATQRSWETGSFKNLCWPTRHSHMIFASSTSPTFLWLYKLREPSFPALLGTAATLSPQSTFPGLTLGQCCLIPTPASSWVKLSEGECKVTKHTPPTTCNVSTVVTWQACLFPKVITERNLGIPTSRSSKVSQWRLSEDMFIRYRTQNLFRHNKTEVKCQ